MSRYEVSIDGRNLRIANPVSGTQKCLGFYATLLVEAADPDTAEAEALSRVQADPHVTSVALEPPEIAVDSVSEIHGAMENSPSLHGPIFCFFDFEAPSS